MRIFDGSLYKPIEVVPSEYLLSICIRGMSCTVTVNGRSNENVLELLTKDGELVHVLVDEGVEIVSSSIGSFDGSSLWFVRYKDVEVVEIETKLRLL